MSEIIKIIERMKEAISVTKDVELADYLGLKGSGHISMWKKRNKTPYDECKQISRDVRISLDWLLTGEGEKYNYKKMTIGSLQQRVLEENDFGPVRYVRAWSKSKIEKDPEFRDPYFYSFEDLKRKAIEGNKSAIKFMDAYDRDWFRYTKEYDDIIDEQLEEYNSQFDVPVKAPSMEEQIDELRRLGTPPIEDFVQVPVYDIQASAGPGVLVESEEQKAVINFSPYYLSSLGVPSSKAAIIYVKGDSMLGTLDPETPILVDTGIQSMQQDGIYVIRIGDTLHVKRIQRQLDGSLKVISDNKVYEPYVIAGTDLEQVQIVGRVVLSVQLF